LLSAARDLRRCERPPEARMNAFTTLSSPSQRKASRTVLVQPAVTSLVPNNPAGIESLLRVVHGELEYLDLNEELFLGWSLSTRVLQEIVAEHHADALFQKNLCAAGISAQRVSEVTEKADEARDAFRKLEAFRDFQQFIARKHILEDAAKIVSAPFTFSDSAREYIKVHHNTVDYYNSRFQESRESLLFLASSAGLYEKFIRERALPRILANNPSIVGISITHPDQYVFAFQLARHLRRLKPDVVTLFGGNTISRRLDTWSRDDDTNRHIFRKARSDSDGLIDGLIMSEGELALAQLTMKMVDEPNVDLQRLFADVNGVVFNKGGRVVFNSLPRAFRPEGLWRRDDTYKRLTQGFMPESRKVHSLVDGRVCSFECSTGGCEFCAISKGYLELMRQSVKRHGTPQEQVPPPSGEIAARLRFTPEAKEGRRGIRIIEQRTLGAEQMAREFERGLKEGFSVVDITDEQFTVDQALRLADALQKRGLNDGAADVVYSCYMRIDEAGDKTNYRAKYGRSLAELLVDPTTAERLARGGMRFVQFGLETTYPAKMVAMAKGTNARAVERFGTILRNFSEHGIMTHVFIIAGAPLKESFWTSEVVRFSVEEAALGRPVTANDLEILEAIYNLRFLYEHRDSIFTIKHTQYKLAFDSPQASRPETFGIQIKEEDFKRRDLGSNIPFTYKEGHGPSKRVLRDLLRLYDLWKKEEMPYQLVTEELMYAQRVIHELGAERIREIATTRCPAGESRLNAAEKKEAAELLGRFWGQLVGREYADHIEKLRRNPNNRPLSEAVERDRQTNLVRARFPEGFRGYRDVYRCADLFDSFRAAPREQTVENELEKVE
jgi:hypothetical protein